MLSNLNYLYSLRNHLRLDSVVEDDLIRELQGHLEDRSQELREAGLPKEEAGENAAKLLGSPRIIAQQIYEVYSQGSWQQTLFAALPHLLITLLFVMRWWHNTVCLSAILIAVISTVIYGWYHGKPTWLFPWLGYLLLPVIVAGALLFYLPGGWVWFAAVAYILTALFFLILVIKQILERDWHFVSLTLLPIPIILGWVIALSIGNRFQLYEYINESASTIGLTFAILALTAAIFIRVKQRWIKAGILVTPEVLILAIVALASKNAIDFWGWLLLTLLAFLLLLGPALLEHKVRNKLTTNH